MTQALTPTHTIPAKSAERPVAGYHAHVYFGPGTVEQARTLCEEAARRFPLKMGRVHEKPVGPHPDWSCQLAFRPEVFGDVIPWLAMNRHGLVIFIHLLTGNDLVDHRDHAIWMGATRPLDLSMLSDRDTPISYDF